MKSHSALYKVTIAPGATININATGSAIFVRLAAQVFRITLDGGQTIDAEEGFDYVGVEREKFTRLELSNPNAESLDVELFVSDGTVRRGPLRFTRDAPTIIGENSREEIVAFQGIITVAAAATGKHRKQLVLFNDSANLLGTRFILYRRTDTSLTEPIGIIEEGQAVTLFTSDAIIVKNGNVSGAAQRICILETVYV